MKPIFCFLYAVLSVFAFFFACKNEPKQPVISLVQESPPPPSPKPEVYLYVVSVDKLNLRDQSNKNSKVITQFAEGDFVESNGDVSPNKEEVTLRGIPFNEPYFKVSSTTPERYSGWAYSAALVPVYAGSRTTMPDLTKLSKFSSYLKTLDARKLDSGKKAWDYYSQNLAGTQGTLADAVFILLERFLFRMETDGDFYTLTEKINWQDADYEAIEKGTFDVNKYPDTKALYLNGFRIAMGEGMVFPVVDWAKLGEAFATKVTPPMKTYMEQIIKEEKEPMWSDGGIIIPLEQVADRAAWWEKFNQFNPYFVRSEETQNSQRGLLLMLICGADNTPVFPGENESLSEDYKKVWAYVQQKYSGTGIGKSVKEMADLVNEEGGIRTKKVAALMEKYMID